MTVTNEAEFNALMAKIERDSDGQFGPSMVDVQNAVKYLLSAKVKLQAFKDYVHQRLDDAGIPTHPDGAHSAEGCRIGDRLDLALAAFDEHGKLLNTIENLVGFAPTADQAAVRVTMRTFHDFRDKRLFQKAGSGVEHDE